MPKKKPRGLAIDSDRPLNKGLRFCPTCGVEMGRSRATFCNECAKGLTTVLNECRVVGYCRKCKSFLPVASRDLLRQYVANKITIILYEEADGCERCFPEDTPDQPHALIVRVPA